MFISNWFDEEKGKTIRSIKCRKDISVIVATANLDPWDHIERYLPEKDLVPDELYVHFFQHIFIQLRGRPFPSNRRVGPFFCFLQGRQQLRKTSGDPDKKETG